MIQVTWEWLGVDPALDLANTVAIADGVEHDMIGEAEEYERWAAAEAAALGWGAGERAALAAARTALLRLRPAVRAVVAAAAEGRALPGDAVAELNNASRSAPSWPELDAKTGELRHGGRGRAAERLAAAYARAAMALAADDAPNEIRRCPAPSCGMFFHPRRSDQHWCSTQCGSRARVARQYRARRGKRAGAR
jgi:predicted RNA-binding Zn ribbon-like protein